MWEWPDRLATADAIMRHRASLPCRRCIDNPMIADAFIVPRGRHCVDLGDVSGGRPIPGIGGASDTAGGIFIADRFTGNAA
jgi:hypothetical protein